MNKKTIRTLSLLLVVMLLLGCMPFGILSASAAGGKTPTAEGSAGEYRIVAWGGIIKKAGETTPLGDSVQAAAGTVLEISLDETKWAGHSFACWQCSDGTIIPEKSFRTLVDRLAAFYPVFSDLTGNFGDWEVLFRGTYCTDSILYARTDPATGLREYRTERAYHTDYTYERINGEKHLVRCQDCPYTDENYHYWDAGVVTTEASHLTDGVKTYTCIQCGEKRYELIERSNSHTYPLYPKDSDYIIDEPAVGRTPGKRHLKCTVCGFEQEPKAYILSALPESTKKVRHFTYESKSPYGAGSGLNSARVEEHYISDNAYYFSIKAEAVAYQFEFLWVNHGAHSPIYIRSGTRYGTPESAYYGIIGYADNREEFISMINSSHMLSGYNNGRLSSHLTSEYSGSRYFEKLWNDDYQRTKLKITKENVTRPGWKTPLTEYEYDYGSGRKPLLYVDENNVCVFQYVGPGDSMELKFTEELDEFPFPEPDRDRITCFGYEVTDGTYAAKGWDPHYGMISTETADDERRVTPRNAEAGKYFSHWEKYNFDTKRFEYCTDAATWIPSVSDVTKLRAVFRDVTYHIKVNGGYYQISVGWEKWSEETFTEGDVPYGTEIRLWADGSTVPEGKETDCFVDKSGERLSSYRFVPNADGEYTMTYKNKEAYFDAGARNGVVKKDGEAFSGGRFPIGSSLTLTSESTDAALYPYFIGWCRVRYGAGGEEYTVISADATYTATIEDDTGNNRIVAVWSASPTLPEKQWHNIRIVKGFAKQDYDGVAVSCLRVPDNTELLVVRDPTEKLKVQTWISSDTDTGTVIETKSASDYGTRFLINSASSDGGKGDGKYDGKGGKPGDGGTGYPANVTVTGTVTVCAEDAHVWNAGMVTTPPDYERDGVKTYTCTVCGTERTESVAKLVGYCVHACKTCGNCTLSENDPTCRAERCTCTAKNPPILLNQSGDIAGVSGNVTLYVTELITENDRPEDTPYLKFVAEAAEGYEIERIYDLSLRNADGSAYELPLGETPTVTLTVGRSNAEALRDGRMFLTHITPKGPETYGVGFRPITVDAEAGTVSFTVESFSPFLLVSTPVAYYGRSALAALPNSEALLYAYDRIAEGIERSAAEINVYNGVSALTKAELETVFDAYRCDRTEHFWLGNGYSIGLVSNQARTLHPSYLLSGDALATARAAFDAAVGEMLSGITSEMSEYAREKLLHDRLAAKLVYDGSAENAHNAYGALVEGRAVCEGYAEAFAYLLRKAGIQSFIVTGKSANPGSGTSEGHAWNLVRIDGKYYHADPTWDDQGEQIFYAYFNKTDAEILEDHTIDEKAYALPACTDKDADYFTVNGGRLPAFDLAAVTELLTAGGGMARVYVTGDLAAFISAFEANLSDVIRGMGLTGTVSASYSSLGREVILKVNAPHIHMWSTEWTGNGTHHWHACIGEGLCNITSDSDKNGYAAHLFDREVADEIYRVAGTDSSYYKSCICGAKGTETFTTYTVRFDANGGTGSMPDVANVFAGSYTLPENGFTAPVGKRFAGWASDAAGTAVTGKTYSITADVTFYAIWEDDPHTQHEYGAEWFRNESTHWHECGVCHEKKDEAAHAFEWKVDREPTPSEEGSGHEECRVCGYKKSAVAIGRLAPSVVEGKESTWSKGGEAGLTFRSDADYADFVGVLVDNAVLSSEFYTVREGSTVVELKASYLETLAAGEHRLTIRSGSGDATASFVVKSGSVPTTEGPTDSGSPTDTVIRVIVAVAVGVICVIVIAVIVRKKGTASRR